MANVEYYGYSFLISHPMSGRKETAIVQSRDREEQVSPDQAALDAVVACAAGLGPYRLELSTVLYDRNLGDGRWSPSESCSKPRHEFIDAGAEFTRLYPICISSTSNHAA